MLLNPTDFTVGPKIHHLNHYDSQLMIEVNDNPLDLILD